MHSTCVRSALCAMQARHARVSSAPHMRAKSASRSGYHNAGETRTCPPCTTLTCRVRLALCRRDTHVSALHRTYVLRAFCAIMTPARHARVRPAPHIRTKSASRYAGETRTCPPCTTHTCGADSAPRYHDHDMIALRYHIMIARRHTHVSALHRTYVRRALCATRARHARVRSAPHIRAISALRHAGETLTCPPCTTRTCGEHFALCKRDMHVSALQCLHRTYVRRALRAIVIQARHARVRPISHMRANSALRYAGKTRTCPPCTAHTCRERFALS